MVEITLRDIPDPLVSHIAQRVAAFTIGVAQVSETPGRQDVDLRGSGTLVQIGNAKAILTAHHVLEVLPQSGPLGLVLSPTLSAPTVDVGVLRYLEIARGTEDERGPDLGAIILPTVVPSSLVAKKSFINLAKHRERMSTNPTNLNFGLWCLCGFQEELTEDIEPTKGFKRVKQFRGVCPVGFAEEAPVVEPYDYLTFPVPHGQDSKMPDRLGGTSGGGLWQVFLGQKPEGHLEVRECLLSGVAFYQGRIQEESSAVRCHGRKSIYDIAYNAIQEAVGA